MLCEDEAVDSRRHCGPGDQGSSCTARHSHAEACDSATAACAGAVQSRAPLLGLWVRGTLCGRGRREGVGGGADPQSPTSGRTSVQPKTPADHRGSPPDTVGHSPVTLGTQRPAWHLPSMVSVSGRSTELHEAAAPRVGVLRVQPCSQSAVPTVNSC